MSLHIENYGDGEPLVLLHGWGMHSGIWNNIVPPLSQHFRVYCVDLPGHGRSKRRLGALDTLDSIVDELSLQFTGQMNLCGWSLGGLVAMRWAQREQLRVQRLALVASTPCFTKREDWHFGMEAETLRQFGAELEKDHVATLRRFLSLQVRGSENERELLMDMRSRLFSHGQPEVEALRGGLEILREVDLRPELGSILQPTLLIAGERDKLTPPEASIYLSQALSKARLVEIAGAAHTPFLSHPEIFVKQITDFMHERI